MNNKKYRLKDIKPFILKDEDLIEICKDLGFNVSSIKDEITEEQYNILINNEYFKIAVNNSKFKPRLMSTNQFIEIARKNNIGLKTLQSKELTQE